MLANSLANTKIALSKSEVYEVVSSDDMTVLVAITPTMSTYSDTSLYVTWFDTIKDRMFEVKELITNTKDKLEFVSEDNNHYMLRKLTLDVFRIRVIPRLGWKEDANKVENEKQIKELLMKSLEYA